MRNAQNQFRHWNVSVSSELKVDDGESQKWIWNMNENISTFETWRARNIALNEKKEDSNERLKML